MQGSVTVGLKCGLRRDSKNRILVGQLEGIKKVLMTLAEN